MAAGRDITCPPSSLPPPVRLAVHLYSLTTLFTCPHHPSASVEEKSTTSRKSGDSHTCPLHMPCWHDALFTQDKDQNVVLKQISVKACQFPAVRDIIDNWCCFNFP